MRSRDEVKQYIFKAITTEWKGTTMIFPYTPGKNILITAEDLMSLIESKME